MHGEGSEIKSFYWQFINSYTLFPLFHIWFYLDLFIYFDMFIFDVENKFFPFCPRRDLNRRPSGERHFMCCQM